MKVTEQIVNSHKENAVLKFLRGQLARAFNLANENLRRLDNGGYKVKFNGTIQRLESSDVKIKKTYVDRLDGNKTKKFDHSNIFSRTFAFQEAVEKMPDRSFFLLQKHLNRLRLCKTSDRVEKNFYSKVELQIRDWLVGRIF